MTTFEIKHKNAHDVEDVLLLDFLNEYQDKIGSVLDVGAHYSHAHYAQAVRDMAGWRYDAVDILPDEQTANIVDRYYPCNLLERQAYGGIDWTVSGPYDCVFSISALEHCGMTSYKRSNPRAERLKVVDRINALSSKFVFLTFPFGQPAHVPGQYENITEDELREWEALFNDCRLKLLRCYFSESPQEGKPWVQVSREECAKIPRDPKQDQQTVAIYSCIK